MKELRVGIIGIGRMAKLHAELCSENPRSTVTCICARNEERLSKLAKDFDCEYTTDYRELLRRSDVDVVLIGAPNPMHFPMALDALKAGKHTAVEYPITQTVEEFDILHNEAQARNLIIHDALTPVIESRPLAMKELLPRIGKVMAMRSQHIGGEIGSWYTDSEKRGNFFAAWTIHLIVYYNVLLDESPDWVYGAYHFHETENRNCHTASYLCHYPSGVLAYNEWGAGYTVGGKAEWVIQGEHGRLVYEGEPGSIAVYTPEGKEMVNYEKSYSGTHTTEMNGFIAEILDGAFPHVSPERSREIIRICEAAHESALCGGKKIELA